MSQQTVRGGGVFTNKNISDINSNFGELYATSVGGALAQAKIIVGDSGGSAAAVDMSGDATIDDTGAVDISGGVTNQQLTVGVAAGYKVARGITALDGSNPTTVATGLTTITGIGLALNRSTSLASGTAFVTYDNISGGSFDLYGWVVAGTASSGTENVAWVAIGT